MNMLLLLYISSFLLLMSHCHQIQEEKFTIWQGYQFNNTVILDLPLLGRNMIDCAFKCLRSQPCKAVSYNDLYKTCDFHGTEHSTLVITNVTDENQYLVIPKDVYAARTVAVESGTTDGTHESDMSTTKQTTKAATDIDDTSTVTNRITSKETKQVTSFTSTGKTTILTTEATTISSQQKNWTVLGADDCYLTTSSEYSGTISYTVNGIPCQYWNTHIPHTRGFNPLDTTAYDTNYCRESTNAEGGPGCYTSDPSVEWEYCFIVKCDACGVDERLPVVPIGTKYHFLPSKYIGMVFTCDTLTPGTSIDHCPVSQCRSDDQWTTGYSVSCTDEDCYTDSAAYQGKVTCTVAGITCQVWTNANRAMPQGQDKNTNYCRDPDNTGVPWCYTTDPDVRWDYCPVPKCE